MEKILLKTIGSSKICIDFSKPVTNEINTKINKETSWQVILEERLGNVSQADNNPPRIGWLLLENRKWKYTACFSLMTHNKLHSHLLKIERNLNEN